MQKLLRSERFQRTVIVYAEHIVPLGREVLDRVMIRRPAQHEKDQAGIPVPRQPILAHISVNFRISSAVSAALSDTRTRAFPFGTVG